VNPDEIRRRLQAIADDDGAWVDGISTFL